MLEGTVAAIQGRQFWSRPRLLLSSLSSKKLTPSMIQSMEILQLPIIALQERIDHLLPQRFRQRPGDALLRAVGAPEVDKALPFGAASLPTALRAASTQWNGEIVMSDDAAVIALPFYSSGDKVALTRDGGATWQVLGGTQELWQSPSVSPDGSRVVASYYAYGGQSVSGTQWSDDYGQTFQIGRAHV